MQNFPSTLYREFASFFAVRRNDFMGFTEPVSAVRQNNAILHHLSVTQNLSMESYILCNTLSNPSVPQFSPQFTRDLELARPKLKETPLIKAK